MVSSSPSVRCGVSLFQGVRVVMGRHSCSPGLSDGISHGHGGIVFRVRPVQVPEQEHVRNPVGCTRVEAGLDLEAAGVPEGSEQHVEHWQICVVVTVDVLPVMNGVTLRPLDQVAQPVRGADIGMLEYRQDGDAKQQDGCGLWR